MSTCIPPVLFAIPALVLYFLANSARDAVHADETKCLDYDFNTFCDATTIVINTTACALDTLLDYCFEVVNLNNLLAFEYVCSIASGVSCIASPLLYKGLKPIAKRTYPDPTLNLSPAEINEISQRATEVKFSGSPTRKEIRKFLKTADANAKRYNLFKKAMETIRWSPNLDSVVGGYLGAPQPRNVKS